VSIDLSFHWELAPGRRLPIERSVSVSAYEKADAQIALTGGRNRPNSDTKLSISNAS
jgi:hypothetical protein